MCLIVLLAGTVCAAQPAPTFTDDSAARISADAADGVSDNRAKAYGVGDLDQDGDLDVVVARRLRLNPPNGENQNAATPNTLFMNVGGVLTDMTDELAPELAVSKASRAVALADLDNDGDLDVIVGDGDNNTPLLLMNNGGVGEAWAGLSPAPDMLPENYLTDVWSIAIGDLVGDGDGFPDVYLGTRVGSDRVLVNLGGGGVCAADCDGNGVLNVLDFVCFQNEWQGQTEKGDCDENGQYNILDFVCYQGAFQQGCEGGGGWLGFVDESSRLGNNATVSASRSSRAIDINGDGDVDIIRDVTNPTGQTQILANDGTGMFTGSPQVVFTSAAYNFNLGELDGDGLIDFYGVRNGVDQFRRNLGDAGGDLVSLGTAISAPASTNGFGSRVTVGDLNGDETDDFLVCDLDLEFPTDCARRLNILYNPGDGNSLTDGYPTPVAWEKNGTADVALIDFNGDGLLDMLIGHCSGNSVFIQDN
jgi:hypothetical protein